jgi:Homeodomain-like domain
MIRGNWWICAFGTAVKKSCAFLKLFIEAPMRDTISLSQTYLPQLLSEIAHVAGMAAALKVAAAKGGTKAYFPLKPMADHWLTLAVGPEAAALICAKICNGDHGIELEVPMGPNASTRSRWAKIKLLSSQGYSKPRIARIVGCHYKTVGRVKNGHRKTVASALAQSDFFEV